MVNFVKLVHSWILNCLCMRGFLVTLRNDDPIETGNTATLGETDDRYHCDTPTKSYNKLSKVLRRPSQCYESKRWGDLAAQCYLFRSDDRRPTVPWFNLCFTSDHLIKLDGQHNGLIRKFYIIMHILYMNLKTWGELNLDDNFNFFLFILVKINKYNLVLNVSLHGI